MITRHVYAKSFSFFSFYLIRPKDRLETHHGVMIADAALIKAAQLSDRYISGRFNPDKVFFLLFLGLLARNYKKK